MWASIKGKESSINEHKMKRAKLTLRPPKVKKVLNYLITTFFPFVM